MNSTFMTNSQNTIYKLPLEIQLPSQTVLQSKFLYIKNNNNSPATNIENIKYTKLVTIFIFIEELYTVFKTLV